MSRTLFLLSIVLSACGVAAQVQTPGPPLAGIAHVALRVSDLNRSRDFYQKLGFEEAFTLTKDGVITESFLKVNDRQFIEMYPQQQSSQPIGFMHVCFEGADLEALNREYLARGLSPTPVKRAGAGNLLFTMEGPEKQNIEYTQYMPGSLHSNDQGKHLGANRISTELVAFGLAMKDELAAGEFYRQQLGFQPLHRFFEPGLMAPPALRSVASGGADYACSVRMQNLLLCLRSAACRREAQGTSCARCEATVHADHPGSGWKPGRLCERVKELLRSSSSLSIRWRPYNCRSI